jgi:hypothetical protein
MTVDKYGREFVVEEPTRPDMQAWHRWLEGQTPGDPFVMVSALVPERAVVEFVGPEFDLRLGEDVAVFCYVDDRGVTLNGNAAEWGEGPMFFPMPMSAFLDSSGDGCPGIQRKARLTRLAGEPHVPRPVTFLEPQLYAACAAPPWKNQV